jgi:hypothetical protein
MINVVLKPVDDSQPEIEAQVQLVHTGSLSFFGTEPKDNSIECVVFED